jgi:hypothetical protein
MSALALRKSSAAAPQAAGVTAATAYVVSQPPFVNSIAVKTPVVAPVRKLRLVKADIKAEKPESKSQWQVYLQGDAQGLLRTLQRMVNTHPLVRSAIKGQAATAGTSPLFSGPDLAHDLYLMLLQKGRFNYYLESRMADAEIEREIFQVELTNYLIGILRRCRPENYRMVRRIGNVLETDERFRPMGGKGSIVRYRQSAETVYGLAEWEPGKPAQDGHAAIMALEQVSTRSRDLRRAGCSGDTQLIVSNQELAALLIEILQAVDGPLPLRLLRQFALAKLPVWDVTLTPIETDGDEERLTGVKAEALVSVAANPAEQLTQQEEAGLACHAAHAFLLRLHASTKENALRTERLCRVMWHCYFDPSEPTQLAIAEIVGVSDSSVGDYRRKLETEMRRLSLSLTQVAHFTEALREELGKRLFGERQNKEAAQEPRPLNPSAIPLPVAAIPPAVSYASIG